MGKLSYNIKSIAEAVDDSLAYINGRRTGSIESLKTRWDKFNMLCMGGIEPNTIYTIGGISGSGKSALLNMLETDILDLNTNSDVVVLNFTFEMMSSRQISRKISKKLNRTTNSLYSIEDKISEKDMQYIINTANGLKKYPIYFVDDPLDVDGIESVITDFQMGIAKNKWLIVELDHTLLVESNSNESEQTVLTKLQKMFIRKKKIGKTTILQLSQMNREIEKSDRINNPNSHYPMRSDISSTDKIYHASDYVFVIHRPEMLGISLYGKNKIPAEDIVFLHTLKNREGKLGIIMFKNELMNNTLTEL